MHRLGAITEERPEASKIDHLLKRILKSEELIESLVVERADSAESIRRKQAEIEICRNTIKLLKEDIKEKEVTLEAKDILINTKDDSLKNKDLTIETNELAIQAKDVALKKLEKQIRDVEGQLSSEKGKSSALQSSIDEKVGLSCVVKSFRHLLQISFEHKAFFYRHYQNLMVLDIFFF